MRFVSTRDAKHSVSLSEALDQGLASDGGLFVPEAFPQFQNSDFQEAGDLASVAEILLKPFFAGDPDLLAGLPSICKRAFDFEVPLTQVPDQEDVKILELFHGPTSAFKDIGARFLAEIFRQRNLKDASTLNRTVIVATSGDTGGAVAAAFFKQPNFKVAILYPEGKISARQEKQLCAWGENIYAHAVQGNFDDCQKMVKEALSRPYPGQGQWTSANSINLGRILPQMVYYAAVSLKFPGCGFVIPSGNLGNALACLWAKTMGLPVGPVHLALNANRAALDFIEEKPPGRYSTQVTLANAMDVGQPSNLERMRLLFTQHEAIRAQVTASSHLDAELVVCIASSQEKWGQVLCPHTAVGAAALDAMPENIRAGAKTWILLATASPAKFESIVEPLVGHALPVPTKLAELLRRPSRVKRIAPTHEALLDALRDSGILLNNETGTASST